MATGAGAGAGGGGDLAGCIMPATTTTSRMSSVHPMQIFLYLCRIGDLSPPIG